MHNTDQHLPSLRGRLERGFGVAKLPDIVERWRTGPQQVIRAREWLSDAELRALATPTRTFRGGSEALAAPHSPDMQPVYVDLGGIVSSARLPFGVFVCAGTSGVQTALDSGRSLICVDWQVPCSMPDLSMAVAQALLACGAFRYAAPEEAGEIALPVLRAILAAQRCAVRALAEPATAAV